MTDRYCIIIPNYNHTQHIEQVLDTINVYQLSVIMINDGSDETTTKFLNRLENQYEHLELLHLPHNLGKGGAVMAGMRKAHNQGFTHIIQVDADGQHDVKDIPRFIELSQNNTGAIICGIPDYDRSVPLGRLIPRYITHFWVWIETLSFTVKDSMCGFRLYPLNTTIELIDKVNIGKRMDFDTEILVRLYWNSVKIINLPTKVTYPQNGSSHFQMVKDNWLITKMHTKLFFGMLPRAPKLIARHFKKKKTGKEQHWSATQERGSTLGIQALVWLYKCLGQWLFRLILIPVIAYFTLTGNKARQASNHYLKRINQYQQNNKPVRWYHVYKHFYQFGLAAIDKIRAWLGDINSSDIIFHNKSIFNQLRKQRPQKGAVFIGSHLGNLELCRALGENDPELKINALVFTRHASKFQAALEKFSPNALVNLIQVDSMGADTAIKLKDKVDAGEIVIIVGDRTSVTRFGRVSYAAFLGQEAPFSQGPFILAGLLDCPTYLIFCLKESKQYNVYLEPFEESLKLTRTNRDQQLQLIIQRYAARLEYYCLKAPYQWFNFFNFWQKDDQRYITRNRPETKENK